MDNQEEFIQIYNSLANSANKMREYLNNNKVPMNLKDEIAATKLEIMNLVAALDIAEEELLRNNT